MRQGEFDISDLTFIIGEETTIYDMIDSITVVVYFDVIQMVVLISGIIISFIFAADIVSELDVI